jgi:hypothetical protein
VTKNIFTRDQCRRMFFGSGSPMYNKSMHLHEPYLSLKNI